MEAQIRITRAIGSEFLARKFRALAILIGGLLLLALAVALWLTTINVWWWLLAVPAIVAVVLAIILAITIKSVIKVFRPELSKTQSNAVREFVDKLERVAENIQTPLFIVVFRVIRDIVRPGNSSFVQAVAKDSTTLHTDFAQLQIKFKD